MVPVAALGSGLSHFNDGNSRLKSVGQATTHTSPGRAGWGAARSAFRLHVACRCPRILYLWIFLRLQGQKHKILVSQTALPWDAQVASRQGPSFHCVRNLFPFRWSPS